MKQMAAFAMGLIGDAAAAPALIAALADPDPLIQGRAAEALGLIAPQARRAASRDGGGARQRRRAQRHHARRHGAIRRPPAVEAVRLGAVRAGAARGLRRAAPVRCSMPTGQPRSRWWPVAYAFQRINDRARGAGAADLLQGRGTAHARVCGARARRSSRTARRGAAARRSPRTRAKPPAVRIQAVRGVGRCSATPRAAAAMRRADRRRREVDPNLQLEAVTALGQLRSRESVDLLIDLVSAPWPSVRAAALTALARTDADTFISAISGLDPDPHWSVRAALATDARRPGARARAGAADRRCCATPISA